MDRDDAVLCTTVDVARLAGVTPEAVRGWERSGALPALRTPSGVRVFRRRDVKQFLAEREARQAARARR